MATEPVYRPKRKGNNATGPVARDEVIDKYAAGYPARVVAKEYGISKNTVMRIVIKAGVARTKAQAGIVRRDANCTRRRRNDPPKPKPEPGSRLPDRIKAVEAEIVELYKSGTSFRAIGNQFSIGNTALRRLLARNAVATRGLKETGILRRTRVSRVPIDPHPTISIAEQVARHLGYGSSKGLSRNREFRNLCEREYAARNPERYRKLNTRRAQHRNRIPKWANKKMVRAFYEMANDLGLTVDHVIPLQGANICGLHVESNLSLLSYSANCAKGNKFDWTSDPLIGAP